MRADDTDGDPIPPTALVMPGPSWALSNVKDTVPLEHRGDFYQTILATMASRRYATIEDLPEPWRSRTTAEYCKWLDLNMKQRPTS
jgi:hypothetical protein